jgi:hypothetical protein
MKALVRCQLTYRELHADRSVTYNITPFGKEILHLSLEMLDKIKKATEQSTQKEEASTETYLVQQ